MLLFRCLSLCKRTLFYLSLTLLYLLLYRIFLLHRISFLSESVQNYSFDSIILFALAYYVLTCETSSIPFLCSNCSGSVSFFFEQHGISSSFMSRKLQSYSKFIYYAANRRCGDRSKVQPDALCFKFPGNIANEKWCQSRVGLGRALHKETGSVPPRRRLQKAFPHKKCRERERESDCPRKRLFRRTAGYPGGI